MRAPVDALLESHPGAAAAGYPVLARAAGRLATVPLLRRMSGPVGRVAAVAEPAGRTSLTAEPTVPGRAEPDHLTVLSANLWHDWPRQRRWTTRLDDVADLVARHDTDVVLLQEVARTRSLRSDARLAEALGMACAYARANGAVEALGFEEGVAVLSRYPIAGLHLRQLGPDGNPLVRRVALAAELDTPLGHVLAVSVHLALGVRANAAQLRELRAWVADVGGGEVAVVGGDFNAHEARREIARTADTWVDTFRRVHPDSDGTTFVGGSTWRWWSPARRIDYVFLQQPRNERWRVLDAAHVEAEGAPVSDHRAVLARVTPVRAAAL